MADLAALRQVPAVPATAVLRPLPPATRFILRGGPDVLIRAGVPIGLVIDQAPCRASQAAACAALWLGPDEYLLVAPDAEERTLARALSEALDAVPHSLVDVSHRQTGLEIAGPHAADILNSGCPLDLDLAAFPVGMCTRTVLAKAEIVLWRTASDVFRIEVWRSFTDYVVRFLNEAANEF
jgi:sarcosine oxidase, subunit gamma